MTDGESWTALLNSKMGLGIKTRYVHATHSWWSSRGVVHLAWCSVSAPSLVMWRISAPESQFSTNRALLLQSYRLIHPQITQSSRLLLHLTALVRLLGIQIDKLRRIMAEITTGDSCVQRAIVVCASRLNLLKCHFLVSQGCARMSGNQHLCCSEWHTDILQ